MTRTKIDRLNIYVSWEPGPIDAPVLECTIEHHDGRRAKLTRYLTGGAIHLASGVFTYGREIYRINSSLSEYDSFDKAVFAAFN